jgi:transposase-like protein
MSRGKPIDPNTKAEVAAKIRDDGLSVADASATYGISSKTIYTWLKEGVVDGNRN